MNYGFIGVGNMAQAIMEGLHLKNSIPAGDNFFLFDIDEKKTRAVAKKYGHNVCTSANETVLASDVLILAIKPDQLFGVLDSLNSEIKKKMPVLVSFPVGITMKNIEEKLGFEAPIIRIVANVNTEVFLSVTSLCANEAAMNAKAEVIKLLEAIGSVIELNEKYFDIFTIIASSAPAFVIKFSEALAEAALKEGLPKHIARNIIADMIHGTGKMLTARNPVETTDMICSPGGTTIVGLTALTAGGFDASIHSAVDKCMERLQKG